MPAGLSDHIGQPGGHFCVLNYSDLSCSAA